MATPLLKIAVMAVRELRVCHRRPMGPVSWSLLLYSFWQKLSENSTMDVGITQNIIYENYMRETTCGGLQHSVVAAGIVWNLPPSGRQGRHSQLFIGGGVQAKSKTTTYGVDVNQELCANLFDARCLPDVQIWRA